MQMTTAIASLHQEKQDPPAKNRVWDFFEHTYSCTGANWQITQCSCPENQPTPTTTVSGVVEWLSKDPIGINGGLNQYVAFDNNPVMFVDPRGLRTKIADEYDLTDDDLMNMAMSYYPALPGLACDSSLRGIEVESAEVEEQVVFEAVPVTVAA